jgi:mono/diheme cytochrome c family protein
MEDFRRALLMLITDFQLSEQEVSMGLMSRQNRWVFPVLLTLMFLVLTGATFLKPSKPPTTKNPYDGVVTDNGEVMLRNGRQIFREDTFGDEAFWGDTLHLHEAIAGEANGGVGPGVSPNTALAVGLKVDVMALPDGLKTALAAGEVDLDSPATTIALLKLNAVLGVKGFFDDAGTLRSMGITCALCHSTVDNSFAPGIGRRLDGWANQDLNVGVIVSLAPNLQPIADRLGTDTGTVVTVLQSWGPGKYDAELLEDGKAFRPDGGSAATIIPPAFGLAGVNLHTWTGWGSVPYWNAYVANTQMHGQGTFYDPRLNDATKFPIAAANGDGNIRNTPDLITSKLPDLHYYQISIPAPQPPAGLFDAAAAARGAVLFTGKAQCSTCHVPPLYTEPGWSMHTPAEIGIDDFQANRSPDGRYRTTPLNGLWTHMRRGFYHDGRFATLGDVIDHYNTLFGLSLTEQEKADLAEYLKSLGTTPLPNPDEFLQHWQP